MTYKHSNVNNVTCHGTVVLLPECEVIRSV